MKLTLCGSIAFIDDMKSMADKLEQMGHEVQLPPLEITTPTGEVMPVLEYYAKRKELNPDEAWVWQKKTEAMMNHFEKVAWSEAIIVVNKEKNGILGYVGPNTFLEMGLAMYLQKQIYVLESLAPEQNYYEEMLGMNLELLQGSLDSFSN